MFNTPAADKQCSFSKPQHASHTWLPHDTTVSAIQRKTEPACYPAMPAAAQGRAITPLDVPLPPGCQLDGHVPGEADAFGVLYQNPDGHLGATIWDGFASQVRSFLVSKDMCRSVLGAVCLEGRAGGHLKKTC